MIPPHHLSGVSRPREPARKEAFLLLIPGQPRHLLLLDTRKRVRAGAGAHLLEAILGGGGALDVVGARAVQVLLELDDLRVDGLELGLVEVVPGGRGAAVGAAARLGGVVVVVFELGEAGLAPC